MTVMVFRDDGVAMRGACLLGAGLCATVLKTVGCCDVAHVCCSCYCCLRFSWRCCPDALWDQLRVLPSMSDGTESEELKSY